MKIFFLIAVILCAAFCVAGQKFVSGTYRIRFKNKQLRLEKWYRSVMFATAGLNIFGALAFILAKRTGRE